ncbi:hypothetical protein HDK64DRAFT_307822 [Phyllosticta capitalensis]
MPPKRAAELEWPHGGPSKQVKIDNDGASHTTTSVSFDLEASAGARWGSGLLNQNLGGNISSRPSFIFTTANSHFEFVKDENERSGDYFKVWWHPPTGDSVPCGRIPAQDLPGRPIGTQGFITTSDSGGMAYTFGVPDPTTPQTEDQRAEQEVQATLERPKRPEQDVQVTMEHPQRTEQDVNTTMEHPEQPGDQDEDQDTAQLAKRFSCGHCDKTFARNYYMRRHERTVHADERVHACPVCNMTFSRNDSLIRHGRKLHKIELPHVPIHKT